MNLQIYGKTGRYGANFSLRTISLYISNNMIVFSSKAVEELGITTEHKILFAKDSDTKKDWYFAVSPNFDNGINIKSINSGYGLKCISCSVVRAILEEHGAKKTASFLVSAKGKQIDGVTWYQIVRKPIIIDGNVIMA